MLPIKLPRIIRLFESDHLIYRMPAGTKTLYLTFDDGPEPEVTPEVLRILKEKNALATFFCLGKNVINNPDIYQSILQEGHKAGNHSYSHLNGWKTPPGNYFSDVMRCNEVFTSAIFRPPYGRFTPSQYYLLKKQFRFVLWSVLSGDFHQGISPDQCFNNVVSNTKDGSIIVFHDSLKAKEKVLQVLPMILGHFIEEGFSFTALPY